MAFGDFVLDMAQARLLRGTAPLGLNGRPLQVLALLAAHPGRLLSKDEVLDAVWGHRHVTESVLKGAVNLLREALGDDARAPRYVETVPRRGYRFVAQVAQVAEVAAVAAAPAAPAAPEAPVPAAPPAPAAAALRPGNLPAQMDALIGRGDELQQVLALMQGHRLVTLTGLGGVGKTRLALAAAGAAEAPADGVWLQRLDDLDDPALLWPTLASLLQLGPRAAAGADELARAVAGLRLRLVLDNAEHLVGAVAELAAALLAAAPGVQLLVTSQLPLRLGPERVLALAPLSLPADWGDSAPSPEGYAAARLLCARIAQQRGGWQPAAADSADIAAICRALDGVPLALELAAARVPLLGLAGVRARLDERFTLLTRGARDAASRHRTLAAALDWTFSLLQPHEREALQRLAVFAGSFTLADAEGVLDGLWDQAALDVVDELHARSLLASADEVAGAGASSPRLRLYDSVRRHALAGLAPSGREADARHRLVDWLGRRYESLHLIDLQQPLAHWLPACQADVDSLRAALRHGLDGQAAPATAACAVLLAAHSVPFWHRSGRRAEGSRWLQQARQRAASQALPLTALQRAWLDHAHGLFVCYAQVGDPVQALADLRAARPLLAGQGDRPRLYASLHAEFQLMLRCEPGQSRRPVVEAAVAAVDPAWPPLAARFAFTLQAVQCRDDGDMAGYLAHGQRFRSLALSVGAQVEAWLADQIIGQALLLLGRRDEACEHYAQAVDSVRAAGWLRTQVQLVAMGAALALRRRLDADSRARALEALRLLASDGMVWWVSDALPWAAWHDGRPGDAARLQAWSDRLVAARGDQRGPIFNGMRSDLRAALGAAADAVDADQVPAGDAAAVELALGPGASAAILPVAMP